MEKNKSASHTTRDANYVDKMKETQTPFAQPRHKTVWGVSDNTHFADRHGDNLEVWEPHNLSPRYANWTWCHLGERLSETENSNNTEKNERSVHFGSFSMTVRPAS